MPLFLLLVVIAALTPIFAVGLQFTQLPWTASACGLLVAAFFCVVQFTFHHWFAARLVQILRRVSPAVGGLIVSAYYISIIVFSVPFALIAGYVARVASSLFATPAA